jgi:hypothetical protein
MAFSFALKKEKTPESQVLQNNAVPTQNSGVELSKPEIEALLTMIKVSTFQGDQVEYVYNLVLKLQQYYVRL